MRRALLRAALLAGVGATFAITAQAAAADIALTASLTRSDFNYKTSTELDGHATEAGAPVAGLGVTLEASPFPYRAFRVVAHTMSGGDGSFSFPGLIPDRNTRYRVTDGGAIGWTASPTVTAYVEAPAVTHLYHLHYGVLQATVLSYHNSAFNWGGAQAYWFLATRGSFRWHLLGVTHTHERKPGVTYMTLTFLPPKGHFSWKVCFNARGTAAYGPPSSHGPCPHRDFRDRVPAP